MDRWSGIEGLLTLPTPAFDSVRRKPSGRFLDNPSIYMGGRSSDQEIDAGLSWEVTREPDGSVSSLGRAFRPFWRNQSWHSAPARPEYYYYPGDTVRMRCAIAEPGKLRLTIDLLARAPAAHDTPSTFPVFLDQELGTRGPQVLNALKPLGSFSAVFDATQFGPDTLQQFKRVNAIDQSGNEGKSVQPTQAHVEGAVWHAVWLLRDDQRLPMIPARYTDMRCPDPRHVIVEPVGDPSAGGERISLLGIPGIAP